MNAATLFAQSVYFGLGASANLSYLRNKKYTFYDESEMRKWVFYPGTLVNLKVGVVPLKGNVSPIAEFECTYSFRRFGQESKGIKQISNPSVPELFWLKFDKKSHDILLSFKVGIHYKSLRVLTGPVLQKFIAGQVNAVSGSTNSPVYAEIYNYSKSYVKDAKPGLAWIFQVDYLFTIKKNFFIAPGIQYCIGINPLNRTDTRIGWRVGRLDHFALGVNIEYYLNLKKRLR